MSSRAYLDTPFAEPEGFWKRVRWWLSRQYEVAEDWKRTEAIRADEARRIAQDIREEFPPSDVADYIEREFGSKP